MVGTRKKVHLGEILVSIRSMSEHCKQVVIPSPHYASSAALLPSLSDVWIFILLQNVFSTRADRAVHCQQHLSLTWARNLKLETLFANATGTEKLTCKLGTLFAQTHFYGKHETLAPLLVAKYTRRLGEFRCIQQTRQTSKCCSFNSALLSVEFYWFFTHLWFSFPRNFPLIREKLKLILFEQAVQNWS